MNRDLTTTQAWWASSASPAWLRTAGIVVGGSAFVAVCAHVSLPLWFTPVPLTLQPFAVLLLGLLLSPRMAGTTLAAYLAEGALGLPVFAPGPDLAGGAAHLFGPTGGYLLAYPAAAVLIALLWRSRRRGMAWAMACAALGDLLILACGASWLAALAHLSVGTALTLAVVPFLPGEALKAALAGSIACGLTRLRRRNS